MSRATLLSRVVALSSGGLAVASMYSLAFALRAHASGLIPFVLMWVGFIGLIVSPSARVLLVEKAAYAVRHRRVIIGSWVYLVCGAIVSIANAVLYPSWEQLAPVSPDKDIVLHFLVVAAPVGVVFIRLIGREGLLELREKKESSRLSERHLPQKPETKTVSGKGSSVLYEGRLWSRSNVPPGLVFPVASAVLSIFVPWMRSVALAVAVLGVPLVMLSPYKIVVTAERLQVKDLVNLFGWSVSLKDVSRVSVLPAGNRIKIIYSHDGEDRVRSLTCGETAFLIETLKSAAPHVEIDNL